MLFGVFSRTTSSEPLRDQLDVSAKRTREIAGRIARASVGGASGFAIPDTPPGPGEAPSEAIDIETEMTALADEQIRFEATAKLLERAYQQFRASLRDR